VRWDKRQLCTPYKFNHHDGDLQVLSLFFDEKKLSTAFFPGVDLKNISKTQNQGMCQHMP